MKMNLKAKKFADKATLEKSLSSLLKKPVKALQAKKVEKLPFCYEAEYFESGGGFMSIGVAKEIQKIFKSQRSKGKGKDADGKKVKVDKKKVAYGEVILNDEGVFEFQVAGGKMKKMQAKGVIKSIPILKKTIGANFIITKAGGGKKVKKEEEDTEDTNEQSSDAPKWQEKKSKMKANMAKMKAQLEKLQAKLG